MRINHNISALNANNQLSKTNKALDKSLEKLSSGFKINRAADDAAGMAISQKMKTQIAALDRASQNAADGISVIQTAEGALTEVETMLQRMRELSVQSANGTNTSEDRASIQSEIDQLLKEIQRISDTTEFNTKTLLNGDLDRKTYADSQVSVLGVSDAVDVNNYNFTVLQDARQAVLVGNTIADDSSIKANETGTIILNGLEIDVEKDDTLSEIYEKLRNAGDLLNINVFVSDGEKVPVTDPNYASETAGYNKLSASSMAGKSLMFVSEEYGANQEINIFCSDQELAAKLGLTNNSKGAVATGVDAKVSLGDGFNSTATASAKGNIVTVTDRDGFEIKYEISDGTANTVFFDAAITNSTAENQAAGMLVVKERATQAEFKCTPDATIWPDSDPATATPDVFTGTLSIGTTNIPITVQAADTMESVYKQIQKGIASAVPAIDPKVNVTYENNQFIFKTENYGDAIALTIGCTNDAGAGDLKGLLGITAAAATTVNGKDATFELSDGYTGTIVVTGQKVDVTVGGKTYSTADGYQTAITVLDAGPMGLQIGANEGQTMEVSIPRVNPKTLGIASLNLMSDDGAQKAISACDDAIAQISAIRAKLGAYQNRLEHSITNLDTTSENMSEALSRIEDTDMAEEMANYTQKQVLSQAGTSMLAQANERPQTILTLLQS